MWCFFHIDIHSHTANMRWQVRAQSIVLLFLHWIGCCTVTWLFKSLCCSRLFRSVKEWRNQEFYGNHRCHSLCRQISFWRCTAKNHWWPTFLEVEVEGESESEENRDNFILILQEKFLRQIDSSKNKSTSFGPIYRYKIDFSKFFGVV
jgi:hypothetical protein